MAEHLLLFAHFLFLHAQCICGWSYCKPSTILISIYLFSVIFHSADWKSNILSNWNKKRYFSFSFVCRTRSKQMHENRVKSEHTFSTAIKKLASNFFFFKKWTIKKRNEWVTLLSRQCMRIRIERAICNQRWKIQSGMWFFCLQNHSVYDSTQFDTNATPVNPLYAASLQSPDSITGYSIDSQEAHNQTNGYQQWDNYRVTNSSIRAI